MFLFVCLWFDVMDAVPEAVSSAYISQLKYGFDFFFTTIFLLLCLSMWSECLMMYYSVLEKGCSVW